MYSCTRCKFTKLKCMKKWWMWRDCFISWFSAWFGAQVNQMDLHVFKSCWDWTEFIRWKHFLALWPVIDVFINFITPREWTWCNCLLYVMYSKVKCLCPGLCSFSSRENTLARKKLLGYIIKRWLVWCCLSTQSWIKFRNSEMKRKILTRVLIESSSR